MTCREPYSDPLTRRERIDLRLDRWGYRWQRFWTETVPMRIARRLPRPVRLWVIVQTASRTGSDVSPDQITYPMMHDALYERSGR